MVPDNLLLSLASGIVVSNVIHLIIGQRSVLILTVLDSVVINQIVADPTVVHIDRHSHQDVTRSVNSHLHHDPPMHLHIAPMHTHEIVIMARIIDVHPITPRCEHL